MVCEANRTKYNLQDKNKHNRQHARALLAAVMALILLLPSTALAENTEKVGTAEELVALLTASETGSQPTSITFTADISTEKSLQLAEGTVIDLDGHSWTVADGTVAVLPNSVVGGTFSASAKGMIRVLTGVNLEYAAAGELVKSVTYADGTTDQAKVYIEDSPIDSSGTVQMFLETNKRSTSAFPQTKRVARVTTAQASYRLGSSAEFSDRLSRVYPISYNLGGGAVTSGGTNPTEYTASDAAITLANPTREGYTFVGWTGTGLSEPTMTVVIPMQSTGARTYTAVWEEAEKTGGGSPGGGFGGGSSGGRGSGSGLSALRTEDTETAEENAEETAEQAAVDTEASPTSTGGMGSGRRISAASSSVEASFHGEKPTLQAAPSASAPQRRSLSQMLVGAALLLAATAGAVCLWKRRDD